MTREEALSKLRPMEAELRARGIGALYLFGSVARDEAGPTSDVDLMCEVGPDRLRGLEFFILQNEIEASLQARVDLIERKNLRPRARARVEHDALRIF